MVLGFPKSLDPINNLVSDGQNSHNTSVDQFSRFEGHEIVTAPDVTRAEDDGTNGSGFHPVCELVLNVELDVGAEFIFQMIEIDVWQIVHEVTRGQAEFGFISRSERVKERVTLTHDLPYHDARETAIGHRVTDGAILVFLRLNGSLDLGNVGVGPTKVKPDWANVVFDLRKFGISMYVGNPKTAGVIDFVNILQLIHD